MKKDLGIVDAIYPMPVLMVAAYDENGKVNVMNAAWGQIADDDKVIIFIGEGKKTWLNILASKAFTVALADEKHMDVADFFGIATTPSDPTRSTHRSSKNSLSSWNANCWNT